MGKITPFLWFNGRIDEAINFYSSIFKNSQITNVSRGADGQVMMASFQLEGQDFHALNGGPGFPFTEAVSFFISCETQQEVDEYWAKLTADGGEEGRCGWLKDKFGLSWQVVPNALGELMGDQDPVKAKRVMDAMLTMNKIQISGLRQAYEHA
jgi:predicted 3-demethylubiquinone-9 3-methyltransferase (glyoxalase superfamily)